MEHIHSITIREISVQILITTYAFLFHLSINYTKIRLRLNYSRQYHVQIESLSGPSSHSSLPYDSHQGRSGNGPSLVAGGHNSPDSVKSTQQRILHKRTTDMKFLLKPTWKRSPHQGLPTDTEFKAGSATHGEWLHFERHYRIRRNVYTGSPGKHCVDSVKPRAPQIRKNCLDQLFRNCSNACSPASA